MADRPVFNPTNMASRRGARGGSQAKPEIDVGTGGEKPKPDAAPPLSVARLAALISGALREGLPPKLHVVGEISGCRERTHLYFDLKDAEAVVNCVMFASSVRRLSFTPEAGQEVVVGGHVEFFAKQGRAQFYVETMRPVGAGALDLEFKRLCEELRGLGWFAPERKRPLPRFPRRVAVVTSRTGAALQDVLDTVRRRCRAVDLALVDVRVQGEGAAREVAAALAWLAREHARLGIDAVLLTRGGGSKEDLWSFNDRGVAEAIVRSPVPVVAAIGHETDTTIAELVADERCATPTQAAVRLTPDAPALLDQLDTLGSRMGSLLRRRIAHERVRLRSAARHPIFTDPGAVVETSGARLDEAARRMQYAVRARTVRAGRGLERLAAGLERNRPAAVYARREVDLQRRIARLQRAIAERLRCTELDGWPRRLAAAWRFVEQRRAMRVGGAARALELVGPASVMRRGYSCTFLADGTAVRSVEEVSAGDVVRTRLADGSFASVVQVEGVGRRGARLKAGGRNGRSGDPGGRVKTGTERDGGHAPRGGGVPPQMDLFSGGG